MSFHFPTLRLPSISLPSLGEIRARFSAFTGKIASKLKSLGGPSTDAIKPLSARQVQSVPPPSVSPLKSLQQPAAKDAPLAISDPQSPPEGSQARFEAKVLDKPVTFSDLPKTERAAILDHPGFKAFASSFAKALLEPGDDETKAPAFKEVAAKLNGILGSDKISGTTKLKLTLDSGDAFIASFKDAIVKQAPIGKADAVRAKFDALSRSGGLKSFHNDAVTNLGGKVSNLGSVPRPGAKITIDGVEYSFAEKLGGGNFGTVARFTAPGAPDIIAKVPKYLVDSRGNPVSTLAPSRREGRTLINAIGTGASAEHINRLEGSTLTEDGRLILFVKVADRGSLASATKLLDKAVDEDRLDASTVAQLKLTAMKDLAHAIERVHAKGITHFDIAARNVVISQQGVGQLADFGLAEEFANKAPTNAQLPENHDQILPLAWSAPEAIKGKNVGTAADTWSFGMALWEVVYGQPPLHNVPRDPNDTDSQHLQKLATKLATGQIDPASQLPKIDQAKWPPPLSGHLEDLLQKIFQRDPTRRPTMDEIRNHPALNTGITGTDQAQKQLSDVLLIMKVRADLEDAEMAQNYAGVDNSAEPPSMADDGNAAMPVASDDNHVEQPVDEDEPVRVKGYDTLDLNLSPADYAAINMPVPGYGKANPVGDYDVYLESNSGGDSPPYAKSPADLSGQPAADNSKEGTLSAPENPYAKSPPDLKPSAAKPAPSDDLDDTGKRYGYARRIPVDD